MSLKILQTVANPRLQLCTMNLIQTDVQQTFDNTNSWRQARVSLAFRLQVKPT